MMESTNKSVDGDGSDSAPSWGAMGGTMGDGAILSSSAENPPPSPASTNNMDRGAATPQQQQQQPYYRSPPGSGSITRFATPDVPQQQQQQQPQSYAARSQQTYSVGGGQQQQPQSSVMSSNTTSGYGNTAPQPQPVAYGNPQQQQQQPGAGASYAARSQQAYGTTPQQQPTNVYGGGGGGASTAGASSYAARSQQAFGSSTVGTQPQQQPNVGVYGGGGGQMQQQQPNVYGGPPPQQQQQQPGSVYSGQQQQTAGSYAARSAAALYGQPQQQQQQQQPGGGAYPTLATPPPQQPYNNVPQQHQHHQKPSSALPAAGLESAQHQKRLLEDATRKVQEHAYYMKQAMEQHNLPAVLDRAAHMVGELGGPPHGQHSNVTNTGCSPKLNPKNYYELYMRALEDMPVFEDYLLELSKQQPPQQQQQQQQLPVDTIRIVDTHHHHHHHSRPIPHYTMRQLYDCVQYCPRVASRLYLQVAAGSALIKSGECGARFVLQDLQSAVQCEQNPVRGLFLRNFLVTALRDKLPDTTPPPVVVTTAPTAEAKEEGDGKNDDDDDSAQEYHDSHKRNTTDAVLDEKDPGTVQDSYEFVLANFMEMNKLWVRIQHLPGEGRHKDVRKRRERERNDLRILVGTNLVRLSQLENLTSKVYGEVILSQILDHIVTTGDPLSQAYLMDCLVQVFPDEYHIETLPILLNVCPRLRDKVNIRTILQGLMDRLANYLAEEELLDETDTNSVKKELARDSFGLFKECVQKVYNARGPKLTSKEVIRLQTALLQFSIKCYPGNLEQVSDCIGVCVSALRQANASYDANDISGSGAGTMAANVPPPPTIKALDEASVVELEKLLSIPLDSLALQVLELDHYSELIGFLPWANRREVGVTLLKAVDNAGSTPKSVKEIEQLFTVIEPLVRDQNGGPVPQAPGPSADSVARTSNLMAGLGVSGMAYQQQQQQQQHPPPMQQSMAFNEQQPVQQVHMDPARLKKAQEENALVSKLVHLLDHENTDTVYEMLQVARQHIRSGGNGLRMGQTLVAVVFASLRLARRVFDAEQGGDTEEASGKIESVEETKAVEPAQKEDEDSPAVEAEASKEEDKDNLSSEEAGDVKDPPPSPSPSPPPSTAVQDGDVSVDVAESSKETAEGDSKPSDTTESLNAGSVQKALHTTSCRTIFVFIQETIASLAKCNPEKGVKLYLDVSLTADRFAALVKDGTKATDYIPIAYEFLSQALSLYDEQISESKAQYRCITSMSGTLLASRLLSKEDYETLITKTAQFSARVLKKPDQCQLVALCAHLFYPVELEYSNPQRALECLQRSLKLADACTSANPANVSLFIDLLEHYIYFFEKGNPLITHAYITGLFALIKEHLSNLSTLGNDSEARSQFIEVVRYVKQRKADEASADLFAPISLPE